MKVVVIVGMIIIGLWVFMGIYPSFKSILDGVDVSGFGTVLAAYVGNMWWIAIILGLLGVVSIWWMWSAK